MRTSLLRGLVRVSENSPSLVLRRNGNDWSIISLPPGFDVSPGVAAVSEGLLEHIRIGRVQPVEVRLSGEARGHAPTELGDCGTYIAELSEGWAVFARTAFDEPDESAAKRSQDFDQGQSILAEAFHGDLLGMQRTGWDGYPDESGCQ